jgi:hypothetical protein
MKSRPKIGKTFHNVSFSEYRGAFGRADELIE